MTVTVTGKDTGMAAYLVVKDIQRIERMKAGPHSFTRVFLKDEKQGHDYFLDVTEKEDEIRERIREKES